VVVSAEPGGPTVRSQNEARQAELKSGVRADPLVQAVLARFPGAEIVDVRKGDAASPPALPTGEPDEAEHASDDDGSAFGAHVRPDDEL
jgi:DNA polymerase-3 subunit gamma/tau